MYEIRYVFCVHLSWTGLLTLFFESILQVVCTYLYPNCQIDIIYMDMYSVQHYCFVQDLLLHNTAIGKGHYYLSSLSYNHSYQGTLSWILNTIVIQINISRSTMRLSSSWWDILALHAAEFDDERSHHSSQQRGRL